jgi:hypothetical protein
MHFDGRNVKSKYLYTEPINTNLLCNMLYDTKYSWQHITKSIPSIVAVVQHICQVTLSTSLRTHQPFVYDTKYCWRRITKRFELNTVYKKFTVTGTDV